jgi:hypothetical protein
MGVTVNITLQDLQCIRQDRGSDGSYPFLWPAMVAINTTNGKVMVAGSEAPSLARVILDNGMKSGDSGAIPSTVGLNGFRFDENLADFKLIAIVALLEKRDLSDDEILGGFLVFAGAVQGAIEENLLGLASPDPADNQKAIDAINASVHQQVMDAIEARMSNIEKIEYEAGTFVPDTVIDTAHAVVSTDADSTFQLTFGATPDNQANFYTIDAVAQIRAILCEAEQDAVNQDKVVLTQLEAQVAEMKKELAQAPPAEKKAIEQDILEFVKTEVTPAKAKLTRDTQALERCRAGSAAAA